MFLRNIHVTSYRQSGATLNSQTLSMETHWIVSNSHVTRCLCFVIDWPLIKVSDCSPTPKFLKCPHDLLWPSFFALLNKWKKIDVYKLASYYWWSFDWIIFFQYMPRDMQKHLTVCLNCTCHRLLYTDCYILFCYILYLNKFIFSNNKISFCSKLPT